LRIPNLPPLQCLIAFEALSRHSSITRAATELEITASAVSRQIVQLEQFLGRTLFIREHRRLKLTVTGQQYGEHVQGLLKECSLVTTELMKARGRMDVTIACASGVAVFWLAPRVADSPRHKRVWTFTPDSLPYGHLS
jgi:DNA-binding transcriptional LysR family regulator